MRARELVDKVINIARNYKTLYVYACFGAPLSESNKNRYMGPNSIYDYNRQPSRANKIRNASADTFGFDCVNLIKGILWGWNGNVNHIYGGATYGSNGCPDTNANGMFWDHCYDQSSDFSNIIPGEFVWMEGHIGVYIGDGLAVECTPIWNDGVQITAVGNIGRKNGYATRTWTSHGKSNLIDYSEVVNPTPVPQPTPNLKYSEGQAVIVSGQLFGTSNGDNPGIVVENVDTVITRTAPGAAYPYNTTGDLGWISEDSIRLKEESQPTPEPENDLLNLVKRTIRGDFGNGDDRRASLGDRYDEVQHQVQMNLDNGLTQWDNIRLF